MFNTSRPNTVLLCEREICSFLVTYIAAAIRKVISFFREGFTKCSDEVYNKATGIRQHNKTLDLRSCVYCRVISPMFRPILGPPVGEFCIGIHLIFFLLKEKLNFFFQASNLCFLLCNYRGGRGVWKFDLGIFGDKTLFQHRRLKRMFEQRLWTLVFKFLYW